MEVGTDRKTATCRRSFPSAALSACLDAQRFSSQDRGLVSSARFLVSLEAHVWTHRGLVSRIEV